MASSTNLVILLGNLTRDPELRYTPNGNAVTSGGIATNQFYKNRETGENESKPEFHNYVVWGKLAESMPQFLKKGSKVQMIGRLQTRQWEDDNGVRHYKTEVVVRDVVFLDKKGDRQDVITEDEMAGADVVSDDSATPEQAKEIMGGKDDFKDVDIPF